MARIKKTSTHEHTQKKTRQGLSKFTKYGNKGGGAGGSTVSKCYKKRYAGQGR